MPSFDVAILDLQLPDKDGFTLADEIRKTPFGRYLPLLLLTPPDSGPMTPGRPQPVFPFPFTNRFARPNCWMRLCRAMSLQIQREKKSSTTPTLDADLARRMPLRVLIADDNPINLKVGLSVLHKLGYRSDVAHDGVEVLKALEQRTYDVLFLDVQMPEMDGMDCARQICLRWTRDKRPVIIAMTGNALLGDREKCLAVGMDDYISKPIRIAELQAALERWGPTKSRKFDTNYFRRNPPPSSAGVLDESIIAELRDMPPSDGVTMLRELIDLFLEGAPSRIAQIRQFLNDPPQLVFHAHALKSISLNLGCKRLAELSQKLEDYGRAGTLENAPDLAVQLEMTFSQTKAQLLALREQELTRITP